MTAYGVPHTGTVAVMTGQQSRAGWRAGRADVKVREPHGVAVMAVDVGCLDRLVTVTTEIAVSLVVRQNENYVGFAHVIPPDALIADDEQYQRKPIRRNRHPPGKMRSGRCGQPSAL